MDQLIVITDWSVLLRPRAKVWPWVHCRDSFSVRWLWHQKIQRKQSNCAIKSTVERQLLSSSAAHWSTAIKSVQRCPAASTKGHRNSSQVFPGCERGKSRMYAALHTSAPRGRLAMSDRCSSGSSSALKAWMIQRVQRFLQKNAHCLKLSPTILDPIRRRTVYHGQVNHASFTP